MSDIVTSQIFATAEKNITATKMNNIIGGATIDPNFYASKPTASSVNPTDQMLILSGGAYAQAPFSTVTNSVGASMGPQITAVRLRSFNAIGNPTFEVDQRNVGNAVANPANGTLICDGWGVTKATATLTYTAQRITPVSPVTLPGTSFAITNGYLRLTLNGQQASLAAGDAWSMRQAVEGPRFRELSSDVHSISLLVRSSVSPLNFGVALRDVGLTRSLVKLCNYSAAVNTWALIQLPNLPVWSGGATWSMAPGIQAYWLDICLGAGTSGTTPANDTWQTGNFIGALGQDNFASKTVGSTFDVAFAQHEPGATATTPMDLDFVTGLDRCLRYYEKSAPYGVLANAIQSLGNLNIWSIAAASQLVGRVSFKKVMAKAPAVTLYSTTSGTVSTVRNVTGSADLTVSSVFGISDGGFDGYGLSSAPAVNQNLQANYVADTGW